MYIIELISPLVLLCVNERIQQFPKFILPVNFWLFNTNTFLKSILFSFLQLKTKQNKTLFNYIRPFSRKRKPKWKLLIKNMSRDCNILWEVALPFQRNEKQLRLSFLKKGGMPQPQSQLLKFWNPFILRASHQKTQQSSPGTIAAGCV